MRIYVLLPRDVVGGVSLDSLKESIRSRLRAELEKYYGNFAPSDIQFSGEAKGLGVYVMERAPHAQAETDREIRESVRKAMEVPLPDRDLDIRLNYQVFNPNFKPASLELSAGNAPAAKAAKEEGGVKLEEFDYAKLSLNYQADEPHYSFEQMILPKGTLDKIMEAVGTIQVEARVFDEWGLRNIIPYATSAMNFYGPPGTGKTMAAEAVAKHLGKKIIRAAYADIESKFHGEGPKMVKAIFRAAEREDAILFLDESDSLLSKRLTNVTDGSTQAINSMRSQLLICLEQFQGIVIFATNLVVNYDKAFLSRLINIEFPMPDVEARKTIWQRHIMGKGIHIPLSGDISIDELAERYVFCGREIKNAVKDACVSVAIHGGMIVTQDDFIKSCERTKLESDKVLNSSDHTQNSGRLTPQQDKVVKDVIKEKLDNGSFTRIEV